MMNTLEKLFLLIGVMCQMQDGSFVILCEAQARSPDTFLCNPQTMLCTLSSASSSLIHLSSMRGPTHDILLSVVDVLGHSGRCLTFRSVLPMLQILRHIHNYGCFIYTSTNNQQISTSANLFTQKD